VLVAAPRDDERGPSMTVEHENVSLSWLARLRWCVLGGEFAAVLTAREFLDVDLAAGRVLFVLVVTAVSNVLLARHANEDGLVSRGTCGVVLTFDALVLTALLHAAGGSSNPFSVLYLVHITVAAMLLGTAWTWALTLLSIAAYGSLFFVQQHVEHMGREYVTHLRGMWFAFVLTATLTAAFVVRLTAVLHRRDREIEAMREQAARSERLAGLTTLAAGAAHELGSPLATIAVAASELERAVSKLPEAYATPLIEDARLIRGQLDRCRGILDQMSAAAGEVVGEAPTPIPLRRLLDDVRADLDAGDASRLRVRLRVDGEAMVPNRALARAVVNLVRNAFDASKPEASVDVAVDAGDEGSLRVAVSDSGHGMSREVLERATEPFFTTKAAGGGMGMGLFLARALVEQLGGRLRLVSAPGSGTTATLELPGRLRGGRGGSCGA
jgi:two-component system sensor histidine kinase RegB